MDGRDNSCRLSSLPQVDLSAHTPNQYRQCHRGLKTKESGFQSGSSVGSPERRHISLLAVFCLYLFFKASGKLHLQVASPTS